MTGERIMPKKKPHAERKPEDDLEAADNAYCFDEAHYGPASETVPTRVEEFLGT